MKFEKRFYSTEFRAVEEDGKKYLEGYAAKFGVRSKLLFENGRLFTEELSRDAFEGVLENDVILTFNHSKDKVMARTTSKTLQLNTDDTGLFFRAELPSNVSYANDIYQLVERGDLNSNSFAFYVTREGQSWTKDEEGNPLRTIKKVERLSDVSVVTNAAYPDTEVAARSYEETREDEPEETEEEPREVENEEPAVDDEIEKLKLKTKLIKIK